MEYEYGIAERNDGSYVIYRNIKGSSIYEYLYDRRIRLSTTDNAPVIPDWGNMGNAWVSYKGMRKEAIVSLLNEAIQSDMEFQQRITATQIKERMSVEEFLKK
jgi:hypothetical protein